ncbi:MAG: OmpA family protein, partial [Pseudomonadota bacterium]
MFILNLKKININWLFLLAILALLNNCSAAETTQSKISTLIETFNVFDNDNDEETDDTPKILEESLVRPQKNTPIKTDTKNDIGKDDDDYIALSREQADTKKTDFSNAQTSAQTRLNLQKKRREIEFSDAIIRQELVADEDVLALESSTSDTTRKDQNITDSGSVQKPSPSAVSSALKVNDHNTQPKLEDKPSQAVESSVELLKKLRQKNQQQTIEATPQSANSKAVTRPTKSQSLIDRISKKINSRSKQQQAVLSSPGLEDEQKPQNQQQPSLDDTNDNPATNDHRTEKPASNPKPAKTKNSTPASEPALTQPSPAPAQTNQPNIQAQPDQTPQNQTPNDQNPPLQVPSPSVPRPQQETIEPPKQQVTIPTQRTFLASIYFLRFSSELAQQDLNALKRISDYIQHFPNAYVEIIGHSSTGVYGETSLGRLGGFQLSLKRAAAIASELVKMGVKRSKLNLDAKGDQEPANNAPDLEAELENRRVEI